MFKFAREGYPFILTLSVITLLTLIFVKPLLIGIIPFSLTLFIGYFFRDPQRDIVEGRNLLYSPADGRVILVRETTEDEILNVKAVEVSIFMSVFNVHVNRAPCEGVVKRVDYYPGRFMAAFREEASKANEHVTMLIESGQDKVVVRQVAGLLARRVVCRAKPGDSLKQGQRFGLIKFSSRVDIFMPLTTQVRVKVGDRVKAGESVLGIIGNIKTEDN